MNSTIIITTFTAPEYTTPRHKVIYCYRTVNITISPGENTAPRDVTANLTRSAKRICFNPVYLNPDVHGLLLGVIDDHRVKTCIYTFSYCAPPTKHYIIRSFK